MFWGTIVSGVKPNILNETQPFHVSMAALEYKSGDSAATVSLYLEQKGSKYLLCSLFPGSTTQVPLSLYLSPSQAPLSFSLSTSNKSAKVHLTGFYSPPPPLNESLLNTSSTTSSNNKSQTSILSSGKTKPERKKSVSIREEHEEISYEKDENESDDEEEEEEESESDDFVNGFGVNPYDKDDDENESDFDLEDDDDDDDEIGDEEEDDEEMNELEDEEESISIGTASPAFSSTVNNKSKKAQKKEAKKTVPIPINFESIKNEGGKTKGQSPVAKTKGPKGTDSPASTPPQKQSKANKRNSEGNKTPENQPIPIKLPTSAGSTPMKTITKGGIMIQESKIGSGIPAKAGKIINVKYEGRLKNNNKKFDEGSIKFRLGKGEVIKGWDIGIEGMKVGGKRKLTIPPGFAYGKRGAPPDIPPNSTLTFEVELKGVS